MRRILIALALFAIPLPAGVASAQDDGPVCHTVRPGLIECSVTEVYGRGPRTFYLLSRSRDVYDLPELRRTDMTREVGRSVRRTPF